MKTTVKNLLEPVKANLKITCLPRFTYVKIQTKHISYEFFGFKPSTIYFISEVYAFPM